MYLEGGSMKSGSASTSVTVCRGRSSAPTRTLVLILPTSVVGHFTHEIGSEERRGELTAAKSRRRHDEPPALNVPLLTGFVVDAMVSGNIVDLL